MSLLLGGTGLKLPAAGGGYTESLVSIPSDFYYTTGSAPSGTKAILMFWSGRHSMTTRGALAGWSQSFFYSYLHDNSAGGLGFLNSVSADTEVSGSHTDGNLSGVRYHVLMSAHLTVVAGSGNDELRLSTYLRDEGSGSATDGTWVEVYSDSNLTVDANELDLITSASGILYGRFDNQTQGFVGDQARFALFSSTSDGEIDDIGSSTVQDRFVNPATGTIVDPAISQAQYGTPLIDLNGPASEYNSTSGPGGGAEHDGTLTLTKSGAASATDA